MRESKPWFAPKRYGYGAGLPIAWQGWAVLAVYFLICVAAVSELSQVENPAVRVPATLVICGVATLILVAVCAAKTRGGWRWRWGGDE